MNEEPDLHPVAKLRIYAHICHFWIDRMSPSEFALVMWLMANTIGRGNRSGRYSLDQFERGIVRRNSRIEGQIWCRGVGMSRSSIRRNLKSLQERGIISITSPNRYGTLYRVNLDWDEEA